MEEIEVPKYFMCPISLQIMRDPVTTMTGITYDRESIEKWVSTTITSSSSSNDRMITCPVTKLPLPRDSDLTPNHTLRRLIQAWCTINACNGVDRIPTPTPPLDKRQALKLVRDVGANKFDHLKIIITLKKMGALAEENERNRRLMVESGVNKAMALFLIRSVKEGNVVGIEEALRILRLVWTPNDEVKAFVNEDSDFIDSLAWILSRSETDMRFEVMSVLKMAINVANANRMERLRLEMFMNITKKVLGERTVSHQTVKSALHVLIEACPWGRNRMKIIESGAVFELIELELTKPEKHTTEMVINLLAHLCSCADGRAQLLQHACGIAMVSKKILRVSDATDDQAIHILSLIAKFSARSEVIMEMLRVGAVTKLCMVMQADCAPYLKEKARGILRLHSKVWNDSPCIAVYLLSRHPR
ncbi:E3 ubiquitin-protein ligase PUB23-like [Humulus lupulus]|uniref:E3 ubiquitin-protein ligase PUB23-like n=1 Tax=Humulus lupulus TaxID=3486 RepID=UPI002B404F5F|nr:E3 ubiquitin-protein ligase PUB23-like [Humulus lupulus]